MKANYTICLDKEKVAALKPWLEKRGLSFSGYLNSILDEQLDTIEAFTPLDGKKVTRSGMLKMAGQMALRLTREIKNENKGKKK